MHSHIKYQMQDCLDKRIARIIFGIYISTKKYHSTANMVSVSTSKFSYKVHKRNMDDQDKLLGGLFTSAKQIQIFKHNFKVVMHGRSNWHQIHKINTAKGVKDILTNFMLIKEDNLKGACIKRTSYEKVVALNIQLQMNTNAMALPSSTISSGTKLVQQRESSEPLKNFSMPCPTDSTSLVSISQNFVITLPRPSRPSQMQEAQTGKLL
eukprot:5625416-Ditylum_brightwellii.AAC.1